MKEIFIKFPIYFQINIVNDTKNFDIYFILKLLESDVLKKIVYQLELKGKISLINSFNKDIFNSKILDIVFLNVISEFNNENHYGFIRMKLLGEIQEKDMKTILHAIERELSDGFGEGFEQNPILIEDIDQFTKIEYYIHLWNDKNWKLEFINEIL